MAFAEREEIFFLWVSRSLKKSWPINIKHVQMSFLGGKCVLRAWKNFTASIAGCVLRNISGIVARSISCRACKIAGISLLEESWHFKNGPFLSDQDKLAFIEMLQSQPKTDLELRFGGQPQQRSWELYLCSSNIGNEMTGELGCKLCTVRS